MKTYTFVAGSNFYWQALQFGLRCNRVRQLLLKCCFAVAYVLCPGAKMSMKYHHIFVYYNVDKCNL